jgi:serine/threonine-protein kinase
VRVTAPERSANDPRQAVDARRVGHELNVRYIVVGETRSQGDTLGVTVRLVATENSAQLWSDQFELAAAPTSEQLSRLKGLLALQVSRAVVQAGMDRALKHPELETPIDFVLRAMAFVPGQARDTRQEHVYYEKALQLDPDFVPAIASHAVLLDFELMLDAGEQKERLLAEMDAQSARAVALDDLYAFAWTARTWALAWRGRWGEAFAANEKAMALVPWSPGYVAQRASLMSFAGRQSEAEALTLRAIEMDPPGSKFEFRLLCQARLLMGRYDEAAPDCERSSATVFWAEPQQALLVALYANKGDTAKAAIARAELLKARPETTIANTFFARMSDVPAYRQQLEEHVNSGLRKAGIPER